MIVELGQWVLRTACAQMVEWNRAFAPPVPFEISVNLSGRQFTRIDLVRMVTDSLEGTGLNADCLKLEITESALMENAQRSARSEEHTSELQSLMRNSYAVFCLKKKNENQKTRR